MKYTYFHALVGYRYSNDPIKFQCGKIQLYFLSCHIGSYPFPFFPAPGESTEIAEEMAARDALKRIFRFDETSSKPLPFGRETKQMKARDSNLTIEEWKSKNVTTV